MNKRNLILIGFAIVVTAQLAVPAWMIIGHELTLREGQVFKFKTQPVDPVDAFRGRYVWLRLEPTAVKVQDVAHWGYNQKAFAVLGTDANGFAIVKRLDHKMPEGESAVMVRSMGANVLEGKVHINWSGLDRYYMTEGKAPAAEAAYREHSRLASQTCHVTVRVRGSQAVIENLFIENKPIRDWLREHPIK